MRYANATPRSGANTAQGLRGLISRDFRIAFTSGVSANKVCFERELLDHYRLVFQKRPASGYVGTPSNMIWVAPTASGP